MVAVSQVPTPERLGTLGACAPALHDRLPGATGSINRELREMTKVEGRWWKVRTAKGEGHLFLGLDFLFFC